MNRLRIMVLTVFVCATLNGFGYSLQEAEEDLRNHQFELVLEQLQPESLSDEEDQAYGVYLLGAAAFHLHEYGQALERFESLMQKHPQSRWFVKAAYRKAECLMQLKRYDEAEAIYAAGIEGLLTQERRCSLAGIYIKHADRFYAPQEKNRSPQYDQARTLYLRALEILPPGILWERSTFQIAMSYFEQEQWKESQKQFQILRNYYENPPESICSIIGDAARKTIANPYPVGGYLDDVFLREGEALFEMGNSKEARRIWKKQRDARRRETKRPDMIAEAAYRVGKTYEMPKPANDKDLSLGVKNLEEYISLFPDHEKVPQAAFDIAQAYFHRSQYDKAISAYREGIERYGNRAAPQMIAAAEFSIAQCLAKQEKFDDAIQAYRTFLANHPVDENWSRAQLEIVSTQYQQVESIQRDAEKERTSWIHTLRQEKKDPDKAPISQIVLDRFKQARTAWESYLKKHPLDSRIASIQLLLGKNERLLRRIDEALGLWTDLASRFPQSDEASEAKFMIAEVAEKEKNNPEKALDLYNEVTFGPFQAPARERIRQLQEISLALRTDQIFQTDETPKVHLSVRNIEQLTCKLHPLDLQTYFLSKHLIRDVEDLDINLIAADKIWDVTLEHYQPYQLHSQDIEIPVEGPGAWVVQVKGETLEAVTLLIVSDLAIAMKGGKKEIFVYAENQRTEKVVPEAEILVSDGDSIVAQGKTNQDGVFHAQNLEAMECYDISVFASFQGHWAGEELVIQNTQTASPLQPRVLIYSDRAGYQPGERVHYRAMIREIENGRYAIPKDAEYQIIALDSRGATIYQKSAALSKFGTLHGEFDLDDAAPMGSYRMMASRKDGPTGSWTFDVQEFTLPAAQIAIETEQKTYFYGDEITGSIQLMDFSGNPLHDELIHYALTGSIEQDFIEERTDQDGTIAFRFETWDLPEEGWFAIHALAPERQIMGEASVILINTGFTISLETTRATYLAGEPFQVQAAARRRDEKNERIEQTLKILLQKRNYEGAYETIDSKTVVTSQDEKKTTYVSFVAESGGDYRIRAEGSDQRGTIVSALKHLKISGDDDANKLLILSDRSYYQQGETASFTVVSRLPENLCLITGEREGIVKYRIETLRQGKNTITWALDDRYSPIAVISLVVMHDGRLHHRDVQFEVRRGLNVSITADAKKYAPCDEAEILIEIRDHNGRPVAAECSLGLVDSALLALFPDRTPDLASYFDQAVRGRFLATNSSVGFRYEGETRIIEEEYLRIVAREEADFLSDGEIGEGLRRGGAIYKKEEAAKRLREKRKTRYTELAPAAEPKAPVALDAARADEDAVLEHIAAPLALKESKSRQVLARNARASSGLAAGIPILGDLFGGGMYGGYAGRPLSQVTSVMVRDEFPLTAYFNGSVITNEDGRATLRIKLPDSLTTWEAAARAITQDALVNQSKQKIAVDKPYRVEIETPAFLTEGDQSSAMAVIRNNTEKDRKTQSSFVQVSGEQEKTFRWEDSLPSGGVQKREFPLSARKIGDSSVTLESAGDDLQDALSRTISVFPWGIPVRSGESSIAAQSVVEKISLPSEADYSRRRMWIVLSGGSDLSLISPIWTRPIPAYSNRAQMEKGLAALAALDCVEALNKTDQAPMSILRQEVETAARHAIAVQSNEGFWSWGGGKSGRMDLITTARAAELLRKAKDRGVSVPNQIVEKTAEHLLKAYQKTTQDREKIQILFALSCIQPPDFSFVNRIHRGIARLNAFDAALLGLTWFNMERKEKAREAFDYVLAAQKIPANQSSSPLRRIQAPANPYDITAVMALLYFQLPSSVRTEKQTQALLEKLASDAAVNQRIQRDAYGWRMQALACYLMTAAEEDQSFTLIVKVNDKEVGRLNASQSALSYRRMDVNPEWIKDVENRIEFIYAGKGKYRYSAVLEGWTRQDVRPQQWIEPQDRIMQQVEREYTHGPLIAANKEIPRGCSVIEETAPSIANILEEVPAGERINVRLWLHGRNHLDHVIVEEQIPAGFLFEQNSIRGPVDHYLFQQNKLVMYLRGPQNYYSIQYQLRARFPGKYRAAPARISVCEAPEQIYATSSQSITVLPKGEQPKIPYKPTPDELYYMGLRYYEIGEFDEASEVLTTLINAYTLRPEIYLETAQKLFLIHLKGDNADELVRYFEIIKERDPNFDVRFEQIAKLGRAYRLIGEYERAVYVYRSLFNGLFLQESALSGTLQEIKLRRESLDAMKQLILEYPDISSVQNAVYTTGSIIFKNVNEWAKEEDFIKAGYSTKSLLSEAVGMIQSFLALYPNNPMADEAGYTLINLWLDQHNFSLVSQLTESFARRYSKSAYLDSYDYLRAYALFQLENYDEALRLAKKVSEAEYPAPSGGMRKSEETNASILMAGKILHAAGRLNQALDEYARVKEAFGDADKSIEFLTQKGLKIEDVFIFSMAEPASAVIGCKNIDQIDLRIYKVDLMTFYLTERNLERITGIDLAGITPTIHKIFDVKDKERFVWSEMRCDLSLPDPGAYLAVVSGSGLTASSMILRSDLDIEVQEDIEQGLVRVNARMGKSGQYAKGVKIQVRGSESDRFTSGETDLRGVFTAAGIQGTATVLAQAGDQYGFYRGAQRLGQPVREDQSLRRAQGLQEEQAQQFNYDALFSNADRLNRLQETQDMRWSEQIDPTNNRLMSQKARSFR